MHAVRRIRTGEWAELQEIRLRLLGDVPWRASDLALERTYERARWDERARIAASASDHAAFVAVKRGVWVGIVEAVFIEDEAVAELQGFWVDPTWRRKAIGFVLLGAGTEWSRDRGASRVISWVREQNEPAISFNHRRRRARRASTSRRRRVA